MITLEQMAIYLPYVLPMGLRKKLDGYPIGTPEILWLNQNSLKCLWEDRDRIPIMRPLSDLTKPITVEGYNDGKAFIPIKWLAEWLHDQEGESFNDAESAEGWLRSSLAYAVNHISIEDIHNLPHKIVIQLVKLGFWIHDQKAFETGEIIDINSLK